MKAIGFDLDESLIDIEEEKSRAFGVILNQFWGVDANEAARYWIETRGKSRRSKFDYFFNKQYGGVLTDDEYRKIERVFSDKLKNEFYPNARFLRGALELLEFSRTNFDITFISSGAPDDEVKYLVGLKDIGSYFDKIYGTGERFRSKEDHFKQLVDEFNPKLIIFIGDGLEDMRVGKKFNAITIGIPSHQTKEKLIEAGAQYVLPTFKISGLLKTILKTI
jgi:phosphoglycolate phosphatase-like HAD superfamily hydrolase